MRKIRNDELIDFAAAAGIGAVAGLRSMTAPAVIALAMHQHRLSTPSGKLSFLGSRKAASILAVLAAGELIADKLPQTPNRTSPPALATRIVSGALAGSAICAARDRSIGAGAILGGFGALVGTFLGFNVRKQIKQRTQTKDAYIAVAEDAIAVGGGALLVAS